MTIGLQAAVGWGLKLGDTGVSKDYLRLWPFLTGGLASLQTKVRCWYSLPFRPSMTLCPSDLVAISTKPKPLGWPEN